MGELYVGVFMLAVISALLIGASAWSCNSQASLMGFESSYGPIQGYMIKVQGKWVPLANYRVL